MPATAEQDPFAEPADEKIAEIIAKFGGSRSGFWLSVNARCAPSMAHWENWSITLGLSAATSSLMVRLESKLFKTTPYGWGSRRRRNETVDSCSCTVNVRRQNIYHKQWDKRHNLIPWAIDL